METPPLLVRRASKPDLRFITSSWLKSNRDAPMVQGIPNTVYYHYHHKILEELIPRSLVLVACDPEDTGYIYGWACAEVVDTALVVHYVYVRYDWRRKGVAKAMMDVLMDAESPPAVIHTHRTHTARKILRNKTWIYNPYMLFTRLPEYWNDDREADGSDVSEDHGTGPDVSSTEHDEEQADFSRERRVSARASR